MGYSSRHAYATDMRMIAPFFCLAAILAVPADGEGAPPMQHRGDQQQAFEAMRQGRLLPLREIERRVVPAMKGWQYIGFDFDSSTGIYTLKFLRDGTVVWIDVDGSSGAVMRKSGN